MKIYKFTQDGKRKVIKLPDKLHFIPPASETSRQPKAYYTIIAYRRPERGEYYVSGAIPAAYEAPSDLSSDYLVVQRKASQNAYDVFLNGSIVDTVFFTDCTIEEVRESLIDHDGYNHNITVKIAS